jgi:hypothetical protein
MAAKQTYLYTISDQKITEIAKDVIDDLYKNELIVNYVHNGKPLPNFHDKLISRKIPSIYTTIEGYISLDCILTKAIKFSHNLTSRNITNSEIKSYREVYERAKINLNQLKKNLENGLNINPIDITQKESEIEILKSKLDELGSLSAIRPEINKKILNTAELAYNILLRNDFYPSKLYQEICSLLNIKINSYDRFPRENRSFNDRPYENRSFNDRPYEKKSFNERPYNERPYNERPYSGRISSENRFSQNSNQSSHNYKPVIKGDKPCYIPPGFRKENIDLLVNNKPNYEVKSEAKSEINIEYKNEELVEVINLPKKNLGVWNTRSEAIFKSDKEQNIKEELVIDDWENITNEF